MILLVPLAVFGVVARTVGHYGFRPFAGLVVYLGVGMLGLAIQVVVVYQALDQFVARMPLRRFWAGAHDAVVYAMGTASSLATLPVTLRSPRPDGRLAAVGADGRVRRHEPEQRRHPALRGDGRPVRRAGAAAST